MRHHPQPTTAGRTVAVATVVLTLAATLSSCGGADGTPSPGRRPSPADAGPSLVEVYSYVIDGNAVTLRAHRRGATRGDATDAAGRVRTAVQALLDFKPPQGEDNLWHTTLCAPSDRVAHVAVTQRLVTVNLADGHGGAVCDLSQQGAVAQRQQIVWTAHTAARNDAPVLVTVGKDGYRLFDRPLAADPTLVAAD